MAAYEQLRGQVLAGRAATGSDAGARGLLVRAGIAAWIERRTAGGAAVAPPAADGRRSVGASLAAEDVNASLVRVLASMAMSNGGERRSHR